MRILLVSSHFYPEDFKANDMAFELVRRGHDVTVLAPIPDYPKGKFYEGYGVFKKRQEVVNGVKIIRSLVIPRHDGSSKWIAANYLSYTVFSSLQAIWIALRKRFDSIIVHETSPVMVGVPAVIVKKLKKLPLYFWVLDLWPESLAAAGGIRNQTILKFFGRLTAWLYTNSTQILISSKGFRKSINKLGRFDSKINYFPNWIDDCFSKSSSNPRGITNLPKIGEGFNIIFAGNIGDAQDIPHLLETAVLIKGSDVNFYFIGDGRRKDWAESFIKVNNLENVHLLGRYPLETMPYVFSKASILILSLKDIPIFSLTVPAKLQAYMSSGKPVVAMINGEGADLIKEADCGWSVPAGDSKALASLLLKLSKESPEVLIRKGENGKRYSETHFNFKDCMDHLESIIRE